MTRRGSGRAASADAAFTALLEDSAEDLYEHAPCGYLSTLLDGTDRQDQHDAAGLARLPPRASWSAAAASPTCSPSAGGSTTRRTSRRCCGCRARSAASPWSCERADGSRLPVLVTSTRQDRHRRRAAADPHHRLRRPRPPRLRARAAARPPGGRPRTRTRSQRLAVDPAAHACCPPRCPRCPAWRSPRTTTPPPPTRSAATSTTCSALDRRPWGFFLGDVCGKGADAAAVTSLARYTLRAAAVYDPDPVAVLTNLNTVLHRATTTAATRASAPSSSACSPRRATRLRRRTWPRGGHPPAAAAARRRHRRTSCPPPAASSSACCPRPPSPPPPSTSAPATRSCCTPTASPRPAPAASGRYGEHALRDFAATWHADDARRAAVAARPGLLDAFGDGLDDDTALLAIGVPTAAPGRAQPG